MSAETHATPSPHTSRVIEQIRMMLRAGEMYWPTDSNIVLWAGDLERLSNLLLDAYGRRVWEQLGLPDWASLCDGYLKHDKPFQPAQRRDIVQMLAPHMTSEDIAVFFDVEPKVIVRDRA